MIRYAILLLAALPLAACPSLTTSQMQLVQVACALDAGVQPRIVDVAIGAGGAVATAGTVDQLLIHPAIVAACARVGGAPQKVTVPPG